MTVKGATQTAQRHPTHATSAAHYCSKHYQQERRTMRSRHRQLVPAAVLAMVLTCSHLVMGGSFSTHTHRLRGMASLQDFSKEEQADDVIDDMCDGRPRNISLTWGHDDAWYNECYEHWREADSLSPTGQWTQTEFTDFVQRQIHASFSEFKQLPLPLTMIFNELSCRCVEHESHDCCHGPHAKIAPDVNVKTWMDSICNRVDNALDEVCRRQQKRAQGSEL